MAVHLACQSLLNGECDMALAGGVSIRIPHHVGYWYEPGSIVSAVGHCRPFDVRADGTVFGSGVGIVVLKPLQAALDDGDRIHAVIRGIGRQQRRVDEDRLSPHPVPPRRPTSSPRRTRWLTSIRRRVSYVETHGTGTPLGDPIEIEALRRAFGVSDTSSDRVPACSARSSRTSVTWRWRPGSPV